MNARVLPILSRLMLAMAAWFALPSCVLLVAGAAILLTLNLVADDTVRSTLKNVTGDKVYAAAKRVIEQRGTVNKADDEHHKFTAEVGAHEVHVMVTAFTGDDVALEVKARSLVNLTPSPLTAREISGEILHELGIVLEPNSDATKSHTEPEPAPETKR